MDVEVKIIDCYHRDAYTTFVYRGKSIVPIRHSEANTVTVNYDDNQYVIEGKEVYYKYKDKIGGVLEIKNYEDGIKRFDIISLS